MIRALALCLLLAACGGPLSLLTGGGPNVAANVQAGAENNQGVNIRESSDIVRPRIQGDLDNSTTIDTLNEGVPLWFVALMGIFLLYTPRPAEMSRMIRGLFSRGR